MICELLFYLLPFFPVVPRLMVAIWFRRFMMDVLGELAADLSNHRSLIVALAGFSFAGLLGLVALPGSLNDRALPIWYILLSFLCYLAALNLQGYKARRWHDHVGDALFEIASLGLIAAVISFILKSGLPLSFRIATTTLAFTVWGLDFAIRLRFTITYLSAKERIDGTINQGSVQER